LVTAAAVEESEDLRALVAELRVDVQRAVDGVGACREIALLDVEESLLLEDAGQNAPIGQRRADPDRLLHGAGSGTVVVKRTDTELCADLADESIREWGRRLGGPGQPLRFPVTTQRLGEPLLDAALIIGRPPEVEASLAEHPD